MDYESSAHAFVGWALETGAVTESADGFVPATMPALPTGFALCGYGAIPQRRRGYNNSQGYTSGDARAAYKKRGVVTPSMTIVLKGGGALQLLQQAQRKPDGTLPEICFFVGVPGVWTEAFRLCKIGQLEITARESQTEATEIEFSLTIEATTVEVLAVPINIDITVLTRALTEPLFWHDVRSWNITDSGGTARDYRLSLMSLMAQKGHNLERKSSRPNWGDNVALSRTSVHLLEHNISGSGSIELHKRLSEAYLTAAKNALDWGDIVLVISDAPAVSSGAQTMALTLEECFPSDATAGATEPGTQLSYSVPFTFADYSLAIT